MAEKDLGPGSSVGGDQTKGIFSSGESNRERVHGMRRWRLMVYIPQPRHVCCLRVTHPAMR